MSQNTQSRSESNDLLDGVGGHCSQCGMTTHGPQDFHPFAACLMFKECGNGNTVEANLQFVVEYGMKAQRRGLSIAEAMHEASKVRRMESEPSNARGRAN